jgi:hypothetical protein
MRPVSPTGLYWSVDGEVACAKHAPQAETPQWSLEEWAPIKVLSGSIHGTLYEYQCQYCAPDGLPVEREARLTELVERVRRHDDRANVHLDRAHDHLVRAEHNQREADRHSELAGRKKAEGPPRFGKRR